MDERTAIARLQRGDIGGLEVLVERYQVKVVRTAYLITHDHALAEDTAQAAFLRAYQRIDQFDARRPFAPWLLRIAANAAIEAARRRERQLSLDDYAGGDTSFADLLPDTGPGPLDAAEASELRDAVWAALRQLPPEQRAAVVLRYYLDLSETEIAEQTGSPPGTIKWRLHAARRQLRALLAWKGG